MSIGALGVLIAVAVIAWTLGARSATSPSASTSPGVPIGQEGRVVSMLGADMSLAADIDGLMAYRNALDADIAGKATGSARAMAQSGRIASIANNTRVRVLEHDVFQTRVLVLDGPLANREGWVYREVVMPLRGSNSP